MDPMIASCGLVCSQCGRFLKGRCLGCAGPAPAFASCPTRRCVRERGLQTCAGCAEHAQLRECRKLNNLISRIFGFVFGTDRMGNLERIRRDGMERFVQNLPPPR